MQNELLDILILGLFVVLFGSIYRQRASRRLRYWVAAWLLVLLHCAIRLASPSSFFGQSLAASLHLEALILAGVCFLLSPPPVFENRRIVLVAVGMVGMPAIFYVSYATFGGGSHALLYLAAAIWAVGGMSLGWILFQRRIRLLVPLTAAITGYEVWTFHAVAHGHARQGISAMLAGIFFIFAALYWFEFRRFSAGVLTTTIGLITWSSAFPAAVFCERLLPATHVPAGVWSLPKFFVAFGMILALLEDEIYAAGKASEHYRLLFFANPHPMWIHDPWTLRFLKVNDAAVKHYGYSRQEFLSMTLKDLRPCEDAEAILNETAKTDSFTLTGPWEHRKKDGSVIQVDIAAHVIEYQGRNCRFVLVQDVTERQRLHEQLLHQAHHDTLTGLPNRLLLEDRMLQTFAHAARSGQRAALICIDLDRFKHVNDTFGHAAGDLCLRQVAERISARLRAIDTVARVGGEEFLAMLGGLDAPRDAEVVARDLLEAIREPMQAGGHHFEIGASMGIAVYPDDGVDSAELWRAADGAMYRAKRAGGDRYLFVTQKSPEPANDSSELERYMRSMLKEDGFEVHYQPVYSISGSLCGLEALLRLNHPRLGLVPPSRFIPLAEECGLIAPLGAWLLREVCRQSAEWSRRHLEPVRISVNVSGLQLMLPDFSSTVIELLPKYGVDPLLLEIEIPESALMCVVPEVAGQMRELARLGIHFSIDDFGTGLSSLSTLHRLPVSTLKIDRSFIERIAASNGTHSIVQASIALGHGLGLKVVAEGVERSEQLETLRRLECDFLQGDLLAPPMTGSQVTRFLKRRSAPPAKPAAAISKIRAQA